MLLRMIALSAILLATTAQAQDRDTKVRRDLAEFAESELWTYNDFEKGAEQARRDGKPLLVVLRCIP